MTKRLLDFKLKPVQSITLAELRETIEEKNIQGNPLMGVFHHVLFSTIAQLLEANKFEYTMEPIYATAGGASQLPGVTKVVHYEEEYGEGALQAHVLRRMITAFNIKRGEDEETTHSIAVAYHQQGIQVAFGPNIKICQNQCIYGSGNRFQTYGDNKMDIDRLYQVVTEWIHDYDVIREKDLMILNKMKEIVLNYSSVCDMIGELSLKRVAKDSLHIITEFILQQNQISDLSTKYLEFLCDGTKNLNLQKGLTLYEFYNICTSMLKPELTDLPNIIGRNHLLGDYLIEKFELSEVE
jgi:hypothetical protein